MMIKVVYIHITVKFNHMTDKKMRHGPR